MNWHLLNWTPRITHSFLCPDILLIRLRTVLVLFTYSKRETANVKNGGKIMITWYYLLLALAVNAMLNLSAVIDNHTFL